jgi:hypothetical protein
LRRRHQACAQRHHLVSQRDVGVRFDGPVASDSRGMLQGLLVSAAHASAPIAKVVPAVITARGDPAAAAMIGPINHHRLPA